MAKKGLYLRLRGFFVGPTQSGLPKNDIWD